MENIKLKFFKYTSLSILAMIGVSIFILADTYFISVALGPIGLAALNFSIVAFSLLQAVGLMIGIGGAIDFTFKSSNNSLKNQSFTSSIVLGIIFATMFIIVGSFFSTDLALFLGADKTTLILTKTYITIILWFSPFFIFNNILLAFVRNDNSPKLATTAMIVGSFSNIILDYIFIFPLSMGILGAALATGLSAFISICILLIHFKNGKSNFVLTKSKVKLKDLKNIIVLGLPSFVTEFALTITMFTFNIVIMNILGNIGVAAYGIIANVAIIVIALFTGLAQGIQPLASHYYSISKMDSLKVVLKYSLVTSILMSITIYCSIVIFSSEIISFFNSQNNKELEEIAKTGFKIYFAGFLIGSINIVLVSFYNAIFKIKMAITISVLRSSILLIPFVLILSYTFGIKGVWASFLITEIIVIIIAYLPNLKLFKTYKTQENIQ